MRKLSYSLKGIFTILFCVNTLFAGVSVTGIGARATSLGGSYRALSDDWSGMYWNPAGITSINGWHVGLATELMLPSGTYKPALWNDSTFSITRQTATQSKPQIFVVPGIGVVHKLSDRFSVGLGGWVPLGMGGKWDLLDTTGYNNQFPEIDYEIDFKTLDFHPTIAFKLNEMFSVGAGIGLLYADVLIRQPLFFQNPYLGSVTYGGVDVSLMPGSKFMDSLKSAGGLQSKYSHLVAESEIASSGLGYSANLGIMVKIHEQLQIGFSGHYYSDVKLRGTMNATMYYPDNSNMQELLDQSWIDTTFQFKALQAYYNHGLIKGYERDAALNTYSGETSNVFSDAEATLLLPLPADVGVGVAWKAINKKDKHLILSSDFQYTFSSVWKTFDIYIDDSGVKDTFLFVQNWNNIFRVSLGIELKINPVWTLRSGYYFEKNAGIPETLTPIFPDINPRNSFNLGVQCSIRPGIALHCGYERILFNKKTVDNWVFNDENMFYDNMPGTYTFNVNNFLLGLNFNF